MELYRKVVCGVPDFIGSPEVCTMHEEYERDEQAERYAALGRKLMDATAGPRYGLYTRILHILKDEIAIDTAEVDAIARRFEEESHAE